MKPQFLRLGLREKVKKGGEIPIKYFLADYITYDGEHEYTEYGVLSARTDENARKTAEKGRKYFTRYGWEEFCELSYLREIPKADFQVLEKYHFNINKFLTRKVIYLGK